MVQSSTLHVCSCLMCSVQAQPALELGGLALGGWRPARCHSSVAGSVVPLPWASGMACPQGYPCTAMGSLLGGRAPQYSRALAGMLRLPSAPWHCRWNRWGAEDLQLPFSCSGCTPVGVRRQQTDHVLQPLPRHHPPCAGLHRRWLSPGPCSSKHLVPKPSDAAASPLGVAALAHDPA